MPNYKHTSQDGKEYIAVAVVTYTDGQEPDEMRGYYTSVVKEGIIQFTWFDEETNIETSTITIPLHRIAFIVSQPEEV